MPGNASFDQIASTTLKNYRAKLQDNVFKGTPLFYFLMEKGRKQTWDGGDKLVIPITASKNSTAKGYTGYQTIDVTPQDNESAAEYVWSQYAASIAISGRQERQNAGSKTRIINLLEAKTKNAENSLRTVMNTDAHSTTLDSESKLNGLQSLVDATSNVGGINRSTAGNEFWQGNVTASGSFATQGIDNMRTAYLNTTQDGPGSPDFGITTQTVFESYEKALQTQQRFTDTKVGDAGFMNLKFKNMTLTFDSACASGVMYMLNSEGMIMVVHPDADLDTTDFVKPANQDAKVAQILFMGNLVVVEPRRLAKLTGITA